MRPKFVTMSFAIASLSSAGAVEAQSLARISPFGQSVSTRSASDRLLEEDQKPEITLLSTERSRAKDDEPPPPDPWFWLAVPVIGKSPSDQLGGVTAILANSKNEFDLGYTHIDPDGVGSFGNVTALYKRILHKTKESPLEFAAEVSYDAVEDTVDTTSLTLAASYACSDLLTANVNFGYANADIETAGAIDDFTSSAGFEFALGEAVVLAVDRKLDSDFGDASNSAGVTYSHSREGQWLWDLTVKGYPGETYIAYAVIPL